MTQTYKLEGLEDALRALDSLDDAFTGPAMQAAAMSGILVIQNAAKQKAPYKTGTLRRSIHQEVVSQSAKRVVVATGTDVVYAAIQEFGGVITPKTAQALVFVVDGHFVRTQRVEIPAHPYMRPAFDENKDRARKEVEQSLLILLRREVGSV